RMIKYGLFSLAIGVILLILAMPITMAIIGQRPISEVAVVAGLYTYSGYAICAVGLLLIIVGIIKRSND
ncbi:MAG TPA: hypothetical protein VLD57_03455, partial [Blastocatellia bacterium]|nr:hypothetical protein [Blastocatellia bacterium]